MNAQTSTRVGLPTWAGFCNLGMQGVWPMSSCVQSISSTRAHVHIYIRTTWAVPSGYLLVLMIAIMEGALLRSSDLAALQRNSFFNPRDVSAYPGTRGRPPAEGGLPTRCSGSTCATGTGAASLQTNGADNCHLLVCGRQHWLVVEAMRQRSLQ